MAEITSFDWIILAFLVVLTIIMLTGKGGKLLNMGSSSKTANNNMQNYDEKKTSRVLGVTLLIATIVEVLHLFFIKQIPIMKVLYGPLDIAIIIVGMVVIYKTCRVKK